MNRDDVIRMAREAGIAYQAKIEEFCTPLMDGVNVDDLVKFAAIAFAAGAAAEREEILAYAKSEAFNRMHGERSPYAYELVNYIRARGQT